VVDAGQDEWKFADFRACLVELIGGEACQILSGGCQNAADGGGASGYVGGLSHDQMLVETDVVETVVGAEAREKLASCWRTNSAGILIDLVPGVKIAGIAPRRIFLRRVWSDTPHRAASVETVIKLSVIRLSTSVNQADIL
jgi:hypothetical protein